MDTVHFRPLKKIPNTCGVLVFRCTNNCAAQIKPKHQINERRNQQRTGCDFDWIFVKSGQGLQPTRAVVQLVENPSQKTLS